MAEGQTGLRKEDLQEWTPWTKIFSAFRVALDPMKLLLAGAGLLTMALGWLLLASLFYLPYYTNVPVWENYWQTHQQYYIDNYADEKTAKNAAWSDFKSSLNSWNFMHMLAGPVPDITTEEGRREAELYKFTAADFADSAAEYEAIRREMDSITNLIRKRRQPVQVVVREDGTSWFRVGEGDTPHIIDFTPTGKVKAAEVANAVNALRPSAQDLLDAYDPAANRVTFREYELDIKEKEKWDQFAADVAKAPKLTDIERELRETAAEQPEKARSALKAVEVLRVQEEDRYKPAGYLATLPWFEYRGQNPFLMISGLNPEQRDPQRRWPWAEGRFFEWLVADQVPVVLEPLVKFLSPVVYLFHPSGTVWIRLYLLLVIFWTIATWSFFGGAITRMAAVQVARPHDSIGIVEAVRFTCKRYTAYLLAQIIPLGFLAVLTLFLIIFGILQVVTFFVGDIVLAGIGLPIVLFVGLIMAVLLVGLVGWPMMHATISSEGSEQYDAISRAYSYVYQKPWSYIWYAFIAILYGAVLIFFVGLMGSLTVYLGKAGMSLGGAANWWDREPSYLFAYAPTSFGWRDLLLAESPHVTTQDVLRNTGEVERTYALRPGFLWPHNYIGAGLVAAWIWLLFLLIVGFGYSYFWTASTIIYLLMRKKIDDTELDEIHLEEDVDVPFMPPTTSGPSAPMPSPTGTVPLQTLDTSKMQSTPPSTASPPAESATSSPPPPTTTPASPPETEPPPSSPDLEPEAAIEEPSVTDDEEEMMSARPEESEPSEEEEEKPISEDGDDREESEREDSERPSGGS